MKKLSDYFWIAFGLCCIGYFIFLVSKRYLSDNISKDDIGYCKAMIINEKNYDMNHRATHKFSYSYQFIIQGATYTGNAHDNSLAIGDTIEIEYNKNHPSINIPLHPKD